MPYQGPMPDVYGDANRYMTQFGKRYPTIASKMNPLYLQQSAENTFRRTGTTVPTDLALAQAQFETKFGNVTRGDSNPVKNPFNIGVYDDKTVYFPKTQQEGVKKYYDVMADDYLKTKTVDDLLRKFVNYRDDRYASNPAYEEKIGKQMGIIRDRMAPWSAKRDNSISSIQSKLNELGYSSGKVDGVRGKKTDAAIRKFQKENGLKVDGIVGPNTKAVLFGK